MQKILSSLWHLDEMQCGNVGLKMIRSLGFVATAIPIEGKLKMTQFCPCENMRDLPSVQRQWNS